jgi:hypothetical protein
MKNILLVLSAFVIVFTACQKELSLDNGNTNPGGGSPTSAGKLLMRQVQTDGTDSTTVDYTYDAAKRLQTMNLATDEYFNYRFVRNATGAITQFIMRSTYFDNFNIDSVIVTVGINPANGRYTYSAYTVDLGVPVSDSTAYTYDAAGNIISATNYTKSFISPSYTALYRIDYTYNAGNIATEKVYDNAGGTNTLQSTSTYTYDSKLSALQTGNEAILLNYSYLFGKNNITSHTLVDADPSSNYSATCNYTYNSLNQPSGATIIETPGPVNYTMRYFYN